MDEATSALDAESEFMVQKALNEVMLHRTTIIVAHRLSTIRDVDEIIVLNNGGVVECGTHNELITKGGEYATLLKLQISSANSENAQTLEVARSSPPTNIQSLQDLRTSSNAQQQHNSNNQNKGPTPSFKKLIMLNKAELPYAIVGSIGAALAGVEPPLFALGITYMLTAFYSNDDFKIKHDVRITLFVFLAMAVITIPIYLMQHYFYTLMGERITIRVRLSMLSGLSLYLKKTYLVM